MKQFEVESELPVSAKEAYAWHARPGALARLTPPWEAVRIRDESGDLAGGTVTLEVPVGPFRRKWVARHRDAVPGQQFVDVQEEGPFVSWVHTHLFEPQGATHCRYVDRISYRLPFGAAGDLAADWSAESWNGPFAIDTPPFRPTSPLTNVIPGSAPSQFSSPERLGSSAIR